MFSVEDQKIEGLMLVELKLRILVFAYIRFIELEYSGNDLFRVFFCSFKDDLHVKYSELLNNRQSDSSLNFRDLLLLVPE